MNKLECQALGGIGRFSMEICSCCSLLKSCDLAKEEFDKHKLKTFRWHELVPRNYSGKKMDKTLLFCLYCGKNAEKCKCEGREEARFEIRRK